MTTFQAISAGLATHEPDGVDFTSSFLVSRVLVESPAPERCSVQVMGRDYSCEWQVDEATRQEPGHAEPVGEKLGPVDVVTVNYGIEFDPEEADHWDDVQDQVKKERGVQRVDLVVGWKLQGPDGREVLPTDDDEKGAE